MVDTFLGQATFGGDVFETNIFAGYQQNDIGILRNQTGLAITTIPLPQLYGNIKDLHIAGNVKNSIFAASVDSYNPSNYLTGGSNVEIFGPPTQLLEPTGKIKIKVEGTTDNAELVQDPNVTVPATQLHKFLVTPGQDTVAAFAKNVETAQGPVVPPSVLEPPYPNAGVAPHGPRIAKHLQPSDPNRRQSIASLPAGRLLTLFYPRNGQSL